MTLLNSISGFRGTIGGCQGESLTPFDVVKYTTAYALWLSIQNPESKLKVVVGRDARQSGQMIEHLVNGTLMAMGVDIICLGLTTTPTTALAVLHYGAHGGVIITASHNPKNWNALKLLTHEGEFLDSKQNAELLELAKEPCTDYADVSKIGRLTSSGNYIEEHIRKITDLPLVDVDAIKSAGFHVVVDAINSSGGIAVPRLLEALGVKKITKLFCEPDGQFAHNPEPLPEHLTEISNVVRKFNATLGVVVDPDVDRLAIVDENGNMFGEEYTLVAVADYILMHHPGNTVSNLSSTQALRVITQKYGGHYVASAVGEVNVVKKMKETEAVIGGEGNGGVIYPPLHYGRDALVGVALFLSHLARTRKSCSALRATLPSFFISKNKIILDWEIDTKLIISRMAQKYAMYPQNTCDGLKIEFNGDWVHLRLSNTESVIRIYAESDSQQKADVLAKKILLDIKELMQKDLD